MIEVARSRRPTPAPYSTTDEKETLAIDTFKVLVDHKRVKLDVRERDKYPNIDGYIELVDDYRVPIGKMEVQIKKLPNNTIAPKLQCPTSLFSYSEVTCNPVLLVGVDIGRKRAYWVHVDKDLVSHSVSEGAQKTKVVIFPQRNVIDGSNPRYISEWQNIIKAYKTKIRQYDKLKDSYIRLSEKANPAVGTVRDDFRDIHVFLDEINRLFDQQFSIVKKRLYPTAWKMGLAYHEYTEEGVLYTLYPIPFDRNDVQIKQVDKTLQQQLQREGLGFMGHLAENPIKVRPHEYAIEVVESEVMAMLKHRLLNHKGNDFLAKEFIFAFSDRFHGQLGLDQKDKYSINEMEDAFSQYLPAWVYEAVNFLVRVRRNRVRRAEDCLYRRPFFDPHMLISQITSDERKRLEHSVRERIRQGHSVPSMPIDNDDFPFRICAELLSYLRHKGVEQIERTYSPRDYSRLKGGSGWVWNVLSPNAVETNLQTFFDNMPGVYHDLVSQNFPEIANHIPVFGDASRVIIVFSVREEYKAFEHSPGIKFFYLRGENESSVEIDIYRKGGDKEVPIIPLENVGKDVELEGKTYRLISIRSAILDFIYDDLPMFNLIYELLEEKLKKYFAKLRSRK